LAIAVASKLLSALLGEDPLKVVAQLKTLGTGVVVVEEGVSDTKELEWVVRTAGWSLRRVKAGENELSLPRLWIDGFRNFLHYGGFGDMLALSMPFMMRTSLGWRPRKCPKRLRELKGLDEARVRMYVVNGVPCAVALAIFSTLIACEPAIVLETVNVQDYAKKTGSYPVSSVPTLISGERKVSLNLPMTVDSVAKTVVELVLG
jgi:hypothetical protein